VIDSESIRRAVERHADVAPHEPNNWNVCRPYDSVVKDGRLHGRGTADSSHTLKPAIARVMDAIAFRTPDRLPRWDNFDLEGYGARFVERWRHWKGVMPNVAPEDFYEIDVSMSMADEGPFFSSSGVVGQDGDYELYRAPWGNLVRRRSEASFAEPLETVLEDPSHLDRLQFDDPADNRRYGAYLQRIQAERSAGRLAFSKIGGIYCRSQFMRREDRLLLDMALDPAFCHALFERVGNYLTRVALEVLRRTDSWDTGIWVYDDCANSRAPMFSPAMWETFLLPPYTRMLQTLKEHGCRHFFFHSDGNIGPLMDLLVQAGFQGFNPLEPRCGLDLIRLRERYGSKVVFFGGVCNTRILPRGNPQEIEDHVRPLIELGRDGGLIIGSASIGNDIAPAAYDHYVETLRQQGHYR